MDQEMLLDCGYNQSLNHMNGELFCFGFQLPSVLKRKCNHPTSPHWSCWSVTFLTNDLCLALCSVLLHFRYSLKHTSFISLKFLYLSLARVFQDHQIIVFLTFAHFCFYLRCHWGILQFSALMQPGWDPISSTSYWFCWYDALILLSTLQDETATFQKLSKDLTKA